MKTNLGSSIVLHRLLLLAVTSSWILVTEAIDISQCIAPIGMETGLIKDEDITASSSFDSSNVGPHHGRLKNEKNGGAWCPKLQVTTEPQEWLEIDLHTVHLITGTATQGRFGNGQGVEFAEAYVLEYWRPRLGKWVRYRDAKGGEVITGNINTYLESKCELDPPIWANKIRFMPYSFHRRTVCMRVELFGCRWTDGVVSYSMPQGDKRGNGWEFYDTAYDGHWDGEELRRGLGQLTDGRVGPDNFKMSYYENDRSQGWVGWRNDTRANKPIEIKFEFDGVREFTCVHIYCNNQFTKDVQVFSEAKVMFSVGGRKYKGEPITYAYIEDRIFENSRNVSIKLHHRVGRFVKLQLHFASKWMMVSEVSFESGSVTGNFTDEEEEDPTASMDAGKETPPLLDKVRTTLEDGQGNVVSSVNANSGLRKYFGVVVGVLCVIVLVMIVAIVFIVIYQKRLKASAGHTVLPGADNRLNTVGKVSMDECDKTALYHEPCRFNMYSASGRESLEHHPGSPEYTDVKDLAFQDYAVPHHSLPEAYQTPLTPGRAPPPLQTLLPKPPPVPPPPEQYYAATEICNAGYVPPPPLLTTPPTVRVAAGSKNRRPRHASTGQL
ncbi:Discoidin domain receptor [Carabus blaptoides fortunei]